jgi:hypothetical protein
MPGDSSEQKAQSKDIVPMLKGWDYEPGTINVRKINGLDGKPKTRCASIWACSRWRSPP